MPEHRSQWLVVSPTWSHQLTLDVIRPAAKRVIDVVSAAFLLALLAPVLLLIAGAVMTDGGSVLFSHRRVGREGRGFDCLKFRSMRPDAERILADLLARDPEARAEWATAHKLRHDPRVTSVGRLLRSTSLDELPQLINVLRGEMSLVGPRPVIESELKTFYKSSAAKAYMSVRPGITGLWQVSGRSDASYDRRVALDIAYASRLSLRQDLRILLRTVSVVLRRDGAY